MEILGYTIEIGLSQIAMIAGLGVGVDWLMGVLIMQWDQWGNKHV